MRITPLALLLTLVLQTSAVDAAPARTPASQPAPKTFCNPLNLDYGLLDKRGKSIHRHGADPVVVLYKDKYWLFSTWDRPGYRVSDDLVNWRYIPFGPEVELPDRVMYTAAAAAVYMTRSGSSTSGPNGTYRQVTRSSDMR